MATMMITEQSSTTIPDVVRVTICLQMLPHQHGSIRRWSAEPLPAQELRVTCRVLPRGKSVRIELAEVEGYAGELTARDRLDIAKVLPGLVAAQLGGEVTALDSNRVMGV